MSENLGSDLGADDTTAFVALIRAQGSAEAAQAISEAENAVRRLQLQAEREVEAVRSAATAQGEERGRRIQAKILAEAEASLHAERLWAREQLLQATLASARQRLLDLDNMAGAVQIVARLIEEAVTRLPEGSVVLSMPAAYLALIDEARIAALVGGAWQVHVSTQDAPAAGGIIASTADGRMRFDNSFAERLRRIEDAARAAAYAALLGDWREEL